MSKIPPGPWGVDYVNHMFTSTDGKWVKIDEVIACRDALTAAEERIRELEAQVDTLRACTVRLADDVLAFGDDDTTPTREEHLRLVREVRKLEATVAALMPGDGGHAHE